jgi:hypothetical protein
MSRAVPCPVLLPVMMPRGAARVSGWRVSPTRGYGWGRWHPLQFVLALAVRIHRSRARLRRGSRGVGRRLL